MSGEVLDFGNGLEMLDGVSFDLVPMLGVALLTVHAFRMHPENPVIDTRPLEAIGLNVRGAKMLRDMLSGVIAEMELAGFAEGGSIPGPKH